MQQYPTYYSTNNPYIDRMNFLQGYQQNMFPTQMSVTSNPICKVVDSIDVVKATDIPMDGNMYYFPKADGTEIYGKQWLNNGQTRISLFKALENEKGNNYTLNDVGVAQKGFESILELLENRFNDLEKRIDDILPKKAPSKTKKESDIE